MSYPSFPDIQAPSYQSPITPEDPGISSEMEDGMIISRPRFTKSRLAYEYHWNGMPLSDWNDLLDFYQNTVKGKSQICTYRGKNGRIIEPPTFTPIGNSLGSVIVKFQEA